MSRRPIHRNWCSNLNTLRLQRIFIATCCLATTFVVVHFFLARNTHEHKHDDTLLCLDDPYAPTMEESRKVGPTPAFWGYDKFACEFHPVKGPNYHFPHTMQQLYRCWSLWRTQSNPILIFPEPDMLTENPFLKGYVDVLRQTKNLKVQSTGEGNWPRAPADNEVVVSEIPHGGEIPSYAFERVDDAAALRELFFDPSTAITCPKLPRISVLNRKVREWTNAHSVHIEYRDQPIEVRHVAFNDTTPFQEQIDFFHETDILISPHGAQLVGIPFMPECGAVIELFTHYFLPFFFGSLATSSQLSHGYIYMQGDERHNHMQNVHTRHRVRNCPLHPPPTMVEDAITQMIDRWQTCCESRHS